MSRLFALPLLAVAACSPEPTGLTDAQRDEVAEIAYEQALNAVDDADQVTALEMRVTELEATAQSE